MENSLVTRFEEQVAKNPTRPAIKSEAGSASYHELDRYADQIAAAIENVMPEEGAGQVALLCSRAVAMIAAMMGTLKANRTYIPLSPDFPENRLNYVLNHAGAALLLADDQNYPLAQRLAATCAGTAVNVDSIPQDLERKPAGEATDRPAYILYTSGSTGTPKGVVQTQRNVLHFVDCYARALSIIEGGRITLISSFFHDAAVMDIYAALVHGATLYPFDAKNTELRSLADLLTGEQIEIYHSVPTIYRHFAESIGSGATFPHLRYIVLGGEQVRQHDIDLSLEKFPGTTLYNLYGQTESSYNSGQYLKGPGEITLGEPIDGIDIFVVDEDGRPVEPLEIGEIMVAGPAISPGYWQAEKETARAFARDEEFGRLYWTGDLGRRLLDGAIKYVGRKDRQLKIRGYRIEPGEIETRLLRYPGIREVAVTGVNGLCAYLSADRRLDSTTLREYLAGELPDYMIPLHFVELPALPLLANGKVDYGKLPEPKGQRMGSGKNHVGPENPLQELLCRVIGEVLSLSQEVSIDDDFFDLGGHSLLVMQVIEKLNRAGLKMEVADIFRGRTVRELAAVIGTKYVRPDQDSSPTMIELRRGNGGPPLVLIHSAPGDLLGYVHLVEHLDPAQPVYGFQSRGLYDIEKAHTTIEEMASCYVRQLVEFYPSGPVMLAGWCLGGTVAFEMAHQLKRAGREVALLALIDCWARKPEKKPDRFYHAQIRYLWGLPLSKWLHYAFSKIRRMFRPEEDPDIFAEGGLLAQCAPVRDLNLRASRAYLSRPYSDKITLLCSRDNKSMLYSPTFGWQFASSNLEIFHVPGTHETILKEPNIAILADRLTALIKTALSASGDTRQVEAGTAPERTTSPMSFAQERLWFLDQIQSTPSNTAAVFRIEGSLSVETMKLSVEEIVRRHESLRTTFAVHEGQPVQVIWREMDIEVQEVKLRHLPPEDLRKQALEIAASKTRHVFDLTSGPLLDVALLHLGEAEHHLLVTAHPGVADAASLRIFARELAAVYHALAGGDAMPLMPHQYADFIRWQRHHWLNGGTDELLRHWQKRLAAPLPVSQFPADHPRSAVFSFRGETVPIAIPAPVHRQMRDSGADSRVIVPLLAAFAALLHRYSGEHDIIIGTPISGRNRREDEGTIGLFVNPLPLRIDVSGDPTFGELMSRVRAVATDAHSHQDVPFEKLLEAVQPERDMSRTPLFQNMLALADPSETLEFSGLRLTPVPGQSGTARHDLTLELSERPDGISGVLEYSTDLFTAATAEQIVEHFTHLLTAAVGDPSLKLSQLPLFSASEYRKITREWNDTAHPYSEGLCIHELFERQARLSPDAPAVVSGSGESLTYERLNHLANQLAQCLTSEGIGRGDLVAIYLSRSPRMIVALLGILKAGAAYVPIDASLPASRREKVMAGISCAVTESALAQSLSPLPDLRSLVCLDQLPSTGPLDHLTTLDAGAIDKFPGDDLSLRCGPDDLAYIIFTSGSTGIPKGVMVRHRPVVNLIEWVNRTFSVNEKDRLLFVTSLSFDLSVYDTFGILAAGGSIHVATEEEIKDPQALLRALSGQITFWDSAPAALQQLQPLLDGDGRGTNLRLAFLSGDWIPLNLPPILRKYFPGVQVVSLGGATEATVWSNYYPIGEISPRWSSIPYGKPIANARYHVLDEHIEPCPIGVAGDLYIGGLCLASGYFRDSRLTAAKFIPDPFSSAPGDRLYYTGDRARYYRDGNIEFLGRIDNQVKIRGFRVELGEIEAALKEHPRVAQCVVTAYGETRQDKRLAAYVVPNGGGEPPAIADFRNFVAEKVPQYMVPAAFILIDRIPVTANGKLDRRALPAPEAIVTKGDRTLPRNAVEKSLAQIWEQVLGVEGIGIHDNFFEWGGDSMLGIQIMFRACSLGIQLTAEQIYRYQTIAEQASVAQTAQNSFALATG